MTTTSTGILSLPGELRNLIYNLIFESLSRPPHHPWDKWRTCHTYLALFLTCRQINAEAASLLWKSYAHCIRLHFDSVQELFGFAQDKITRYPRLQNARFSLSALKGDPTAKHVRRLVAAQPGFNSMSPIVPSYAGHYPTPGYWEANHFKCSKMSECIQYSRSEPQISEDGCRFTSYVWLSFVKGEWFDERGDKHDPVSICTAQLHKPSSRPYQPAGYFPSKHYRKQSVCWVLQGRIKDVQFDGVRCLRSGEGNH